MDTATIDSIQVLNVSSDTLSINFTGLTAFTNYDFSVAAFSFNFGDDTSNFSILVGNFSTVEIVQTLEDCKNQYMYICYASIIK